MSRVRGLRRAAQSAMAVGLSAGLSSCALSLESLPLAGPGASGDTYSLTAEFTNALNLPTKAKVRLNGADIGEVATIRARDFTALVDMRIRDDVAISEGARVELRSATPLGDLFVAIQPNPDPGAQGRELRDGDIIGEDSTTGGATVEEVLSSAALLVNGGVIKNVTTLVNGAGGAIGGRGSNVSTLLERSATLISGLNTRSGEISAALQNTSDLAATLHANQESFNTALAAAGPATATIADNTDQLIALTTTVSRVTDQLSRFPSLQGTDTRSLVSDINKLSAAFNTMSTDPQLSLNELNRVLPIALNWLGSTNLRGTADAAQLAFGSLPDMNFAGDPMMHGPDGTDWHAMIGSLRYQWNLLLGKIYGPR